MLSSHGILLFLSSLNCVDAMLISCAPKLLKQLIWLGAVIHGEYKELRLEFHGLPGNPISSGLWTWFYRAGSYKRGEIQYGNWENRFCQSSPTANPRRLELSHSWKDGVGATVSFGTGFDSTFGNGLASTSKQVCNKNNTTCTVPKLW